MKAMTWIAVGILLGALVSPVSADWPAYRHDAQRSAVTAETLTMPLSPAWTLAPAQAPRPAWPQPSREVHRIDFDFAPQPVVAGGLVLLGSSADDTVRAFDAATGAVRWRFITGGPVRLAPHVAGGRAYFGSDDGFVYCVDLRSGEQVWRFRAAPGDDRIPGQGRMISRWPVRTDVLVADGVAYAAAGMWPSEGVFVYALNAKTGRQIWCNDTSGRRWTTVPHGAKSFSGVAPQGYLLAGKDVLLVPTGRSVPAGFDRKTGKLMYYDPQGEEYGTQYYGGSWAIIRGDGYYNNSVNRGGHLGLQCYALPTGKRRGSPSRGRRRIFGAGAGVTWTGTELVGRPGKKGESWRAAHTAVRAMAMAGKTLIVGGDGKVSARASADGKELWSAVVEGEARGLAIADGRLIVTTSSGAVHCFGVNGAGARVAGAAATKPPPAKAYPAVAAAAGLTDASAGFALVLGEPDAKLAATIAARTRLRVVCVLTDKANVEGQRRGLLAETYLYGTHVAVARAGDLAKLPYGPMVANLIVVGREAAGLDGGELYRLLRPCGGVMCFVGTDAATAARLVAQTKCPPAEIRGASAAKRIVRGKLPGALDWDSKQKIDARVKWPLRLAWFGGPGPGRTIGLKTPFAAEGRLFLVDSNHVTVVDAYNGAVIWSRKLAWDHNSELMDPRPRRSAMYGFADMSANAESFFLHRLNKLSIEFDAATGRTKKYYGLRPPATAMSLATEPTLELPVDEQHSGTITLSKTAGGLKLRLVTVDPKLTDPVATNRVVGETYWDKGDHWDLFFDFRPRGKRFGFYGEGAFHVAVVPAGEKARAYAGAGAGHPKLIVTGGRTETGSEVTLLVKWPGPAEFGFGAALTVYDGGGKPKAPPTRVYKFADANAWSVNNGWATVVADGPAPKPAAPAAFETLVAAYDTLDPKFMHARRPPLRAIVERHPPRRRGPLEMRLDPLTGETEPRRYARSHGCGGTTLSAAIDAFRSGTLSIYDLVDDSGVRSFGGIRANCGVSTIPALGMLLAGASNSTCKCGYNFDCSLGLVPTDRRGNEDWAVFPSKGLYGSAARIRTVSLNLGAPGDRRDDAGALWLGFPRPGGANRHYNWVQWIPYARRVPLAVETLPGMGPYRLNADRVKIDGADQPWIYASGYRGLTRAVLALEPRASVVSLPAATAPAIDGKLGDACWDGKAAASLSRAEQVWLRHDAAALYVAYRRPTTMDRRGKPSRWKANVTGNDGKIYDDDAFGIYLGDDAAKAYLHVGVSPTGARYDARCDLTAKQKEARPWSGDWASGVVADGTAMVVEIAVPWKTVAAAGLDKASLAVNYRTRGTELIGPGASWSRCENFCPVGLGKPRSAPARTYTVRLHFAELDEVAPGARTFDVKLQGKVVLAGFDVIKAAGGRRRAVVREFKGIVAGDTIALEMIPKATDVTPATAPILSAFELIEESRQE